jgi:hypothetical protein
MQDSAPEPRSARNLRDQLDAGVVDAIERAGWQCSADADLDTVVTVPRSYGLTFLQSVAGLVLLKGVGLAQAKLVVHNSTAFATDRDDREAFWADLHSGIQEMISGQDQAIPAA